MKKSFLLLIAFITLISCSETVQKETHELQSLEIEDKVLINENTINLPDEIVFGSLYSTVVNSEGDIFSLDARQKLIFHFDSTGNFLNTIGGEGRGPGEFESVYDMITLDDSRLLVYDYMQARSTIFDEEGAVQKIINMEFQGKAISNIRKITEDEILLTIFQNDHLAQVYDLSDEEIKEQVLKLEDLLHTEQKYESVFLESFSGTALPISGNRIVYTPKYYNGELDVYEKMEGEWKFKEKMRGYEKIDKSFTIHETTSEPHERAQLISVHPEKEGYLGLETHSQSMGLFSLSDNRFAHLSYRDTDSEKTELKLIYEIFDAEEMHLEKAGRIDSLKTTYPPQRMPVWIDEEGYLYIVENPQNPTLKKTEVLWEN